MQSLSETKNTTGRRGRPPPTILLLRKLGYKKSGQIFLLFCHNSRVWQTDRRTDRQLSHRYTASAFHAAR